MHGLRIQCFAAEKLGLVRAPFFEDPLPKKSNS